MYNTKAQAAIDDCRDEIKKIRKYIQQHGQLDSMVGFLTRYILMKTSSSLELAYKTIIADYYLKQAPSMGEYLTYSVRKAKMNASYQNIMEVLGKFSKIFLSTFKTQVQALPDSDKITSNFSQLKDARNDISHGSTMTLSFSDIVLKFEDSIKVIEVLDDVIH